MDDEEDEDSWRYLNAHNHDPSIRNQRDGVVDAVTHPIMRTACPDGGGGLRQRAPLAQIRDHKLFSLVLFALVCSPWAYCATNANVLASNLPPASPPPTAPRSNVVPYDASSSATDARGSTVADGRRRIRHDTVKSVASNKRLITFESSASNSLPAFDDDDDEEDAFEAFDVKSESQNVSRQMEHGVSEPHPVEKRRMPNDTETTPGAGNDDSCSCKGSVLQKISRASHDLTTIKLQHHILNASEGIVSGIVYQGKME